MDQTLTWIIIRTRIMHNYICIVRFQSSQISSGERCVFLSSPIKIFFIIVYVFPYKE